MSEPADDWLSLFEERYESIKRRDLRKLVLRAYKFLPTLEDSKRSQDAYIAAKQLYRFAKDLDLEKTRASFIKKKITFDYFITLMESKKYDAAIALYDHLFGQKDMERAIEYFNQHAKEVYCGAKNGMMYSYVNIDGKILRRGKELGKGAFGRVTFGHTQTDNEQPLCIKKQPVSGNSHREGTLNLKVGIATSPLKRRNDSAKDYQYMHYLGLPSYEYLHKIQANDDERLRYAIDLIIEVNRFHTGEAIGSAIVHGDIKPENIMIDDMGELKLIDWAFSQESNLAAPHAISRGTPAYVPISFDLSSKSKSKLYWEHWQLSLRDKLTKAKQITPNYFFDDKIAILRTIHHGCCPDNHPDAKYNFLTGNAFAQLPACIRHLLETHDINQCIKEDQQHTLQFLSAALIFYRKHHRLGEAELARKLNQLMRDPSHQTEIIQTYQNDRAELRQKLKGADKKTVINMLLVRDLEFTDLPLRYRCDPDVAFVATYFERIHEAEIRPSFDSFGNLDEASYLSMIQVLPKNSETILNMLKKDVSDHAVRAILSIKDVNVVNSTVLSAIVNKFKKPGRFKNQKVIDQIIEHPACSRTILDWIGRHEIDNITRFTLIEAYLKLAHPDDDMALSKLCGQVYNKSDSNFKEHAKSLLEKYKESCDEPPPLSASLKKLHHYALDLLEQEDPMAAKATSIVYIRLKHASDAFIKNASTNKDNALMDLLTSVRMLAIQYKSVIDAQWQLRKCFYGILNAILSLIKPRGPGEVGFFKVRSSFTDIIEEMESQLRQQQLRCQTQLK